MSINRFIEVRARRTFRCAIGLCFVMGIGALGACRTQQQRIVHHEDNLAAGAQRRLRDYCMIWTKVGATSRGSHRSGL